MPSSYAHEPNMRVLESIRRCVTAMQHSKVESCAALFSEPHRGFVSDAPTAYAKVRREVEPVRGRTGAREPQLRRQPSATTCRDGWSRAEHPASTYEVVVSSSPLFRCAAHRGKNLRFPSTKSAEEDVVLEEHLHGMSSNQVATGMRHGEAHLHPPAVSCVVCHCDASPADRRSMRSSASVSDIHRSSSDPPDAARALYRAFPSGSATHAVARSSTTRSHLQRQPPPCPPWNPTVAMPGPTTHPFALSSSADRYRDGACASRSSHSTLSSLSVSKLHDASRISLADSASSVNEVYNAASSLGVRKTISMGNVSSQASGQQPGCQEEHACTRPTSWTMSQGRAVPLALSVQRPAYSGSATSFFSASSSPPSVTAAVGRRRKGVIPPYDMEIVWPADGDSPQESSRAFVAPCFSHFRSSTERGSRRSTSSRTTMRRSGPEHRVERVVTARDVMRASSYAATAPASALAVVATSGGLPLNTKNHLSDAVQGSSPLPRNPQAGEAERLVFVRSVEALANDSPPSSRTGSDTHSKENSTKGPSRGTPPQLTRAPNSLVEPRLVSSTLSPLFQSHTGSSGADAVKRSGASPVSQCRQSLCSSPPATASTASTAVGVPVVQVSLLQNSTRRGENASARYRDASSTLVASCCPSALSAPCCGSLAVTTRADSSATGARQTHSGALSRQVPSSAGMVHQPSPSLPFRVSPSVKSSAVSDVQHTRRLPHEFLSPHSSYGVRPLPEGDGDELLRPLTPTGSSFYSLTRCSAPPLKDDTEMPDVAKGDSQRSRLATLSARDVPRPTQRVGDGVQETLSNRGGRLRGQEDILGEAAEHQKANPQTEAVHIADRPLAEVRKMMDVVGPDEGSGATGATQGVLSREGSEERQNVSLHQQQRCPRYLAYMSPRRSSGASPLSPRSFAAVANSQGQSDSLLFTPVSASPMMPPPLALRGTRGTFVGDVCGDNTPSCSPTGATRREMQVECSGSGNGCVGHPEAASTQEAVKSLHAGKTAVSAKTPGDVRLTLYSPFLEDAGWSKQGNVDGGAVLLVHRDRGGDTLLPSNEVRRGATSPAMRGGGLRAGDSGYTGSGGDSHSDTRESQQPIRYLGRSEFSARHGATCLPVTPLTSFDSQDRLCSDVGVVEDDHVVQPGLPRHAHAGESLALPSWVNITTFGSASAPEASAVCRGAIEGGCVPGSKNSLAPPLTSSTFAAENSSERDSTRYAPSEGILSSRFTPVLHTPSRSRMPSPNLQRPPHTTASCSSAMGSTGGLCMSAFASLEGTPLSISVTDTVAMEVSAIECEAPAISTFFAVGHVTGAVPLEASIRGVAERGSKGEADHVPVAEGPRMWVDEEEREHARPRVVEDDRNDAPPSSWRRSPSPGVRRTERPSSAAQSEGERPPDDVGAEATDTAPRTSSDSSHMRVTYSKSPRLVKRLHTNSALNKGSRTHTRSATSTAATRVVGEVFTRAAADLGSREGVHSVDKNGEKSDLETISVRGSPYLGHLAPVLGVGGGNVSSTGTTVAEPCEAPSPTSVDSAADATATQTAVTDAAHRSSMSRQRTRLSLPAVLLKPPMEPEANRYPLVHGLHLGSTSPFRGGECAVVSEHAGGCPQPQRAIPAVDEAAGGFSEEDDDADNGYCGYGYESALIYV